MTNPPASPLPYTRHTIDTRDCVDVADLAKRLVSLGDAVAVNLVGGDGTSAVFCEAHVRSLLGARPDAIVVDTIPSTVFRGIVTSKMARAERDGQALRDRLRTAFVTDEAAAAIAWQQQLELIALLLDGFTLQRGSVRLRAEAAALTGGRQSLAVALGAADNVLVMDSLQHEIVPALRALTQLLT